MLSTLFLLLTTQHKQQSKYKFSSFLSYGINFFQQLWYMKHCCYVLLVCITSLVYAQPPIGAWRDHLPYNAGIAVIATPERIYAATSQAIFYIDKSDNSIHKLGKVNGLAETGISALNYISTIRTLCIGYTNGNIDLIVGNKIININDIKRKNILGDKRILNMYYHNSLLYCSTGFGIVVIDVDKQETRDTYFIGNNGGFTVVYNMVAYNNQLYAATALGLLRANATGVVLNNFNNWTTLNGTNGLPTGTIQAVHEYNNTLIVLQQDTVRQWNGSTWAVLFANGTTINSVQVSNNTVLIAQSINTSSGKVLVINNTGLILQTIQQNQLPEVPKAVINDNGTYWIADFFKGLYKVDNNTLTQYQPNAPISTASGAMYYHNNVLYATAGAVNNAYNSTFNANGMYTFKDDYWEPIWRFNVPAMDSMLDFISITANDDALYAGSYGGGLLRINANNAVQVYKQNSPILPAIGDPTSYRVSGLALDLERNLWVANYGSSKQLHVLQPNNTWASFAIPFAISQAAVAQLIIDDDNQKWIVSPKDNGLLCYNSGTNLTSTADDNWKWYRAGTGNGNLPTNDVRCIAKDNEGVLWIGTSKGIALIQCTNQVFAGNGCQAILPIVQQDQFAGFLFQNEVVNCIAVDGANRKWIGTNNGLWLISSNGDKIIYRFSQDNSPLLSNAINNIAINPTNGEVLISTSQGICSYRSTATQATEQHSNVLVYPNPVPPHYNGTIAIKGLANASVVKITELNGRLVYQTKALGGQAVWNGRNYKGEPISTGIYLVLATSETSNAKVVAKIVYTGE